MRSCAACGSAFRAGASVCVREIRARTSEPEYLARHQLDQATALVLGEIAGEAVDRDVDGQGLRVRLSPERFGDGRQVAHAEQHDVRGVLARDSRWAYEHMFAPRRRRINLLAHQPVGLPTTPKSFSAPQ